ncbi:hypothetical protein D3C76_1382450 [compost metagenome]
MAANARIQSNTFNHLPAIEAMQLSVGVKFIEKRNTHRKVGIGKQLDRLCFGAVGKQHGHIFLDRPFQ